MLKQVNNLSRFLERQSPAAALAYFVPIVLFLALGTHWLIARSIGMPIDVRTFVVAGLVTLLISSPLIAGAQKLINRLGSSQAMMKALVKEVVVARDQALRANSFKSQFLANLSHELRTPLNAIIGFAQLLERQSHGPLGDARYLDYIGDINLGGQHMLDLVNDVLALAKLESGTAVTDDNAETDVRGVVSDVVHLMLPLAERKGISLGTTGAEADCKLMIGERMLRQMVLNIVSNAIKFTEAGGIVRISVENRTDGALAIRVHDTGIGMSKDDLMIALTPFGQVTRRNPGHSQEQGTGLGLPLVKAMMDLHQGVMQIDSVPGEGTIVSLGFPADRVLPGQMLRRANIH